MGAAALATAVGTAVFTGAPEEAVDPDAVFVDDYLRRAVAEERIETSDVSRVRAWLTRELGLAMKPLVMDGLRLAGAEICLLNGRRGAMIQYELEGQTISHYLVPRDGIGRRPPAIGGRGEGRGGHAAGHVVEPILGTGVGWRRGPAATLRLGTDGVLASFLKHIVPTPVVVDMESFAELFSFQGRANRARYFTHVVLDDLIILVLVLALIGIGLAAGPLVALPIVGVIVGGIVAVSAIAVKRLHDMNMSGWHLLGMAIPLWNIYLSFKMLLVKGTHGPNRFGPDPLAPIWDLEEPDPPTFLP